MTLYAYKCRICGARFDSTSRSITSCPECLSRDIGRDYSSVRMGLPVFQPHFNHAVGEYVTSPGHFDKLLKMRGEQAGTTYTRIDPGDMPRPTKDDHMFDTQMKTIRDKNINPEDLV